jgi:hypothetical protein
LLVKALRGDSIATATVAATAAITAAAVVIVAGIGIHTRLGIEITKLTQDILVLLHIADLRLRVRQLGTKLIQILRLDQITCQLILLNDGRLDVAAARLHLGAQLIEGKLVSITVLKNLLLGRAIAREDITLNLRKIIRNDRGAITETAIAEETTAIESQEEQEDQDNPEEASATPRIMTIVILESLHHKNIAQFCHC